jgi:hypothetical protein
MPIGFRMAGELDDLRFVQKATAIQRTTTIHYRWNFFNHE